MMRSSAGGAEKMQYLDYENYRHITFKWHFKLTKALVILLESKDYMQVCIYILPQLAELWHVIYTPSLTHVNVYVKVIVLCVL